MDINWDNTFPTSNNPSTVAELVSDYLDGAAVDAMENVCQAWRVLAQDQRARRRPRAQRVVGRQFSYIFRGLRQGLLDPPGREWLGIKITGLIRELRPAACYELYADTSLEELQTIDEWTKGPLERKINQLMLAFQREHGPSLRAAVFTIAEHMIVVSEGTPSSDPFKKILEDRLEDLAQSYLDGSKKVWGVISQLPRHEYHHFAVDWSNLIGKPWLPVHLKRYFAQLADEDFYTKVEKAFSLEEQGAIVAAYNKRAILQFRKLEKSWFIGCICRLWT